MRTIHRLVLAAALTAIASGISQRQFITWLGASNITGDSDVFTTGTYVDGLQAARAASTARTPSLKP